MLAAATVREVLDAVRALRAEEALPWAAVVVRGFDNSLVGWGGLPTPRGGESNYAFVMGVSKEGGLLILYSAVCYVILCSTDRILTLYITV
mgnify:CR=1 FL=1